MKLPHIGLNKAALALIGANIIWGAASPIFKFSLINIKPFTLAFFRFFLAAVILFPLAKEKIKKLPRNAAFFLEILPYPIFGITINISAYFFALKLTESINAPIIGASGPIFTFILAVLFLKEKISYLKVFGMLISFFGVTAIIIEPLILKGFAGSVTGNLLMLLATLSAVGQTISGKSLMKKYDPIALTFISFVIGAVTFIPFLPAEISHLTKIDYRGVLGIIYGAVFSSAIAYSLYAWALSRTDASRVSVYGYLDPVFAIIIAYPLLNEVPNIYYLIGTLLVFFGLTIFEKPALFRLIPQLFDENHNRESRSATS